VSGKRAATATAALGRGLRLGWGALLALDPDRALGSPAGERERRIVHVAARALAARYLLEAALAARWGDRVELAGGAADLLHAGSMLLLVRARPELGGPALRSAAVSLSLASLLGIGLRGEQSGR
jgi:hypothetical protein